LRRIVPGKRPRQTDREFVHLLAGYGTEYAHLRNPKLTRRIIVLSDNAVNRTIRL
jgi:hypothetical protein